MDNLDTQPASINDLERAVLSRNYTEAEQLLIKLIRLYGKDKIALTLAPFDRKLTPEQADLESYQALEKLAYSLTIWFSDPNYQASDKFYTYISLQKNFISNIFVASSYHSTDHITQNLGLLGKSNYTVEELKRILFLFTIESDLDLPWIELQKHLPNHVAACYTGLISNIGIHFSKRAVKNLAAIVEAAKHFPSLQTSDIGALSPLFKGFFNCSNIEHTEKYEIKKWIISSLVQFMDKELVPGIKKRIKSEVVNKTISDKPTILIVCEEYTSGHAMYRGWHTSLAILKDKYHVVGLAEGKSLNTVSRRDFDEVIEIDEPKDVSGIVKKVLKLSPDLIIYTSLGMSIWAPLVATQRLAPIQMTLSGHPSSTYIPNMDYFLLSNCPYDKSEVKDVYSEQLVQTREIWIDATGLKYKSELFTEEKPKDRLRVVVNGVIQKITFNTIEMCKRISQQTEKPVEFLFFMASPKQDIEYFAAKSLLRRFLPNALIFPFGSYQSYMDILNTADLALPTVPFGGSNSNVDVLRLGVPKLLYSDKSDVSAWSDLAMWLPTGLTEHFLCESVQEVETRAIELLNSPEDLEKLSKIIKESEPEQKIYTGNDKLPYVLEAVEELFEKHS